MGRSFGSRLVRTLEDIFEPEKLHDSMPENETVTGAEDHPTEGDPSHGIPAYPHPLPGAHEYQGKEVTKPERLPVAPNKPYYSAGMAHGVKSPERYDGRIAPQHGQRRTQETEHEPAPEFGHYKLEPIPVYVTEPGAGVHPIRQASFRQVIVVQGADPQPIVERNPQRTRVLLLNESANAARMKWGPTTDIGSLLPASMNNYRDIYTEDQIYAVTDSTATGNAVISIIEEYKIARI